MLLGLGDTVFLIAVPVCVLAEAIRPRVAGHSLFSRENGINLIYLALKAVFAGLAGALGARLNQLAPHPGLGGTPLILQCLVVLLAVDAKQYMFHRLTHKVPWLWRLHKVHHSTQHINWLAIGRTHLLDFFVLQMLTNTLIAWALGVSELGFVLGYAIPSLLFGGLIAHLNVDVPLDKLGWFGRLVVTPNYHAPHHGLHPKAVNLAEVLPLWDILFGTYEAPEVTPREFGLYKEPDFPTGIIAQQLSPFYRKAS